MSDELDPKGRRLLTRNRSRVQLVAEQGDDGTYEIRVSPDAEDGVSSSDEQSGSGVSDAEGASGSSRRVGPWLSIGLLVAIGAVGAWMLVQDNPGGPETTAVPAFDEERSDEGSSFRGFVIRNDEAQDSDAAREGDSSADPGRGVAGFVYEVPVDDDEAPASPSQAQRSRVPAQETSAPSRRDPLRVEQLEPAMRRPELPSAPVLDAEAMRNLQRVPVHRFVLADDEEDLEDDLGDDLDEDLDYDDLDDEELDALLELEERYEIEEW